MIVFATAQRASSWLVTATLLAALTCAAATEPPTAWQDGREYVGTERCVLCHSATNAQWLHTRHAAAFPTDGAADGADIRCETCHGPGSKHVRNPATAENIIRFTLGSPTPVDQQNEICMNCHRGGERIHWLSSTHELSGLACADCHNPMAQVSGSDTLAASSESETCFRCHQEQRAQFQRRSHMPLLEGQMTCSDCHNAHGSPTDPLLRADSVNENCYQCHAELRGPHIFEHAPVVDSCVNCHEPHGSNHDKLLITAMPFLCQQCHTSIGHMNDLLTRANMATGPAPDVRLLGRSCVNCHAQIHGSNHPAGATFNR